MRELFLFIYKIRVMLLFIFLELVAGYLVVKQNSYQRYSYLSSSNRIAGNIYELTSAVVEPFILGEKVEELALANEQLKEKLFNYSQNQHGISTDSVNSPGSRYKVTSAKVINNSVLASNNFLTLAVGAKDGIASGMGVISDNGIVGRVKSVSKNFSTVYSFLHSGISVSSQLAKDSTLCTTKWNSEETHNDYTVANLLYLPPHVKLEIGDSVVTSGYNSVFPEGIPIGSVKTIDSDPSKRYQTITIDLATDFSKLKFVYVVKDNFKKEIRELETSNLTN
ncbi:rod shape-determining protein MreC [Flexithrix dorotheae]|uniref:rod shape-determining protein MreC n=1 Tax=Flexithrix dorotheae TaxID=70993 RepID=UPI000475DB04|nr:rod shape-determining protein MreC [Flexithrix dorotheae]